VRAHRALSQRVLMPRRTRIRRPTLNLIKWRVGRQDNQRNSWNRKIHRAPSRRVPKPQW
jgi:hypothetical protein